MRTLMLFHHDPWRTDDEIDAILVHARRLARDDLEVRAAYEGLVLELTGDPIDDGGVGDVAAVR